MEAIYFSTDEALSENSFVMSYYIDHINLLDITFVDGTYAEGVNCAGDKFEIHAGGDGDDFNHKIEFKPIDK